MSLRRTWLAAAAAGVFVVALPASSALAGTLTLHPSGFGEGSYTAWKAKQGEPDTRGADNQALYFQKMVPTATFSAGVAIVKGIEGLPSEELTGLAWDHRTDGHCGAGAPRWNVGFRTGAGVQSTLFLGCFAAQHTQLAPSSGHGWCRDEQPSPATLIPPGSTITSLAIVFDEGNDTPNPPPPGCDQEQPAGGFVHLDNITVETSAGTKVWTSANDNGNR